MTPHTRLLIFITFLVFVLGLVALALIFYLPPDSGRAASGSAAAAVVVIILLLLNRKNER